MQTLRKKTSPLKYRNEPGRFFGDGVSFKAKLIGILEVGEARGDRMCQEALQDLKMAIRAAGEHKQRITIHVTIDGLRLRDEKTGDSLYHHPVHKISFIAQDMSDSRAFGYIFGSPDSGHRFFGIKTDKAASQVVLAMRDLFQVVFELKKKEIELARQHIQSKITAHEHQAVAMSVKSSNADGYGKTLTSDGASGSQAGSSSASGSKTMTKSEKSPESVADLVDLEQELSSIQRGITQMERITPNEVPSKSVIDDDPFGDSFTNMPPAYNLLPPPESSKRHQKQTHRSTENIPATESSPVPVVSSSPPSSAAPPVPTAQNVSIPPPQPKSSTPGPTGPTISTSNSNQNDDWLNSPPNTSRFDPDPVKYSDELNLKDLDEGFKSLTSAPQPSSYTDVFTDLDPLGTGKIKPYVDKKYFFQELKNPPKKVLRDLSGTDSTFNANFTSEDLERQSPSTIPQASTNAAMPPASTAGSNDLFKPSFDDNMAIPKEQTSEFSDPFTNRNVDPFMEDDDFSKLHIDPFELHFSRTTSPGQIDSKPTDDGKSKPEDGKPGDSPVTYNGPLQVNLPPESWASYISQKRMERQNSDTIPPPGTGITGTARNRPNVFKQNTVDVISSISSSSKKMKPNLFGQKFSKRDSNSINMRRLQESDSLSENETAPEPPPRPDHTGSHIEPPPLPPKKQFADIVIRPTPRSGSGVSSGALGSGGSTKERYDYVGSKYEAKNHSTNDNAPPLPLPSRKVNRGDGTSPGRPFKKLNEEDDYLQPIPAKSDIPTLLPPPQRKDASKTRAARKSETDPRNLDEPTPPAHIKSPTSRDKESLLPDITLSQLLTLGIDELASKLNVPVSKLNTMTLVELTSYLSEFIENSKTSPSSATSLNQDADNNDSPVFKVNFDDHNDATFVAKFDDNFGEDNTFVANFDSMNLQPAQSSTLPAQVNTGPAIDKYAVFREIIEQEIGPSQEPQKPEQEKSGSDFASLDFDKEVASEMNRLSPNITGDHFAASPSQSQTFADASPVTVPMTKIDTKITEVISQAKDRYAALRDIILVEDLFEKPNPPPKTAAPIARMESSSFEDRDTEDEHKFETNFDDMPQVESHSPEINISDADINDEFGQQPESQDRSLHGLEPPESQNLSFRNTPKEDLEIDAFMQKAVSNLSLHSTGQQSPAPNQSAGGLTVKSPQFHTSSTSPNRLQQSRSPAIASITQNASVENLARTTMLNDMSTSPIPVATAKSPAAKSPILKQPSSSSPHAKSPMDGSFDAEGPVGSTVKKIPARSSGSISEGGESSPEADRNQDLKSSKLTPTNTNESWAVFDQPEPAPLPKKHEGGRVNKGVDKNGPESPCSSDPKDEWKNDREYGGRRWPAKGHTSSSSRDVSPWDEEGPDYRKRPSGGHHPPTSGERYHHPRMPPRRINSNDEDYEDDMKDRGERRRRMKGGQMSSRSRDNFDDEHWYHEHQGWSPEEDERPDRSRSFDRNAYERSTYGPPYEKREPKSLPQYDRRDYKNYDKRKYYRDRGRSNYDYDPYVEGYDPRMMKGRVDYEDVYERGPRDSRAAREYFYERERKSFDRDSNESYERRSFGSGDIYGSLDSRGDYRERDRYLSLDKTRSLRRGVRNAGSARLDDPEQDSEGDLMGGGGGRRGDTNSLHRSSQNIRGKHQQVVDDEVWGASMGGKPGWKRPSSATEQERRYNESRRMLANTSLAGSDGEKDRRFRKKSRNRSKDSDIRPGYATMRYPPRSKEDYFDFEADSREGGGGGDGGYDNDEEEDVRGGKMMGENIDESPSYYGRRPLPPYYKPTTPRSESRTLNDSLIAQEAKKMSRYEYEEEAMRRMKKSNSRDLYFEGEDKERFSGKFGSGNFDTVTPPKSAKHVRMEFEFEDFGDTPQSNTSSKFNFEGGDGFESDFNSPPAPPSGNPPPSSHHSTTKSFRFSNDFSEKDPGRHYASYHQKNAPQSYGGGGGGFEADFAATPRAGPTAQTAAKLRFNEQVTVSKFNSEANTAGTHMFEDDFAGRSDNELEDQWTCELQAPATSNTNGGKKILKSSSQNQQQQDNLRKSDSVNIFAKKVDDPFEDDDFFSAGAGGPGEKDPFGGSAGTAEGGGESAGNAGGQQSGWDKNFANFDDNI